MIKKIRGFDTSQLEYFEFYKTKIDLDPLTQRLMDGFMINNIWIIFNIHFRSEFYLLVGLLHVHRLEGY